METGRPAGKGAGAGGGVPARGPGRGKRLARRRARSRFRTALLMLTLAFVGILVAGSIAAVVAVQRVTQGLDIRTMRVHLPGITSTIRDRSGRQLAVVASTQNRIPVPSRKISPWLKKAT